ncbi:MAG: hypothetical protein ABIV21_04770 [Pyrinomonadaceae bacterium]
MRSRFLATAAVAVLLLNISGLAFADTPAARAKRAQATRLVALLPASDGVAVFDAHRFFNGALPQILSANQPMLSEVMAKVNEMENRTGIDLRKFEQVVVGVRVKQVSPTEMDFEPVVLASGDINAGALIAVGKLSTSGTYREEKIGSRTVYVITPKAVIQKTTGVTTTNSKLANMIDNALHSLSHEVAVTALDRNTLVIGSLARLRETLDATTHVTPEVSGLLSVKETAVASFAFKAPGGLSKMLPLENDDLGANIEAIKFISGTLDVASTGTALQVVAKTTSPEKANGLKDTVEGLAVLGKVFLGSSKRPDQQVYGRMLRNAKFAVRGNDVALDVLVPQSDIDIILGAK